MPAVLTTDEQLKDLRIELDRARDAARAAEKDANDSKLAVEKATAARQEADERATAAEAKAAESRAEAQAHAAVLEDAQTTAAAAESAAAQAVSRAAHTQESLDAVTADNEAAKERIRTLEAAIGRQDTELARLRPIAEHAAALVAALEA